MTAATGRVFGPKPYAGDDAIAPNVPIGLAAAVAPKRNWLMGINSSGYIVAQAAAVLGLVSAGVADQDQSAGTAAGDATATMRQQYWSGFVSSTATALDTPSIASVGKPLFAVDNQTVGLLSNYGGVDRSFVGIQVGWDFDTSTPVFYVGPLGWTLARAAHLGDNHSASVINYPVDGGATADLGSAEDPVLMPRDKVHGVITSIEIIPSADLAATGSNDKRVITVYKIDTLTGTVGALVGTFTTATQALAKRVPTQFTLGAAADLQMLETDVLGYASLHSNSGAIVPQSTIRANMKVA